MTRSWTNWARTARCSPASYALARDEDHVAALVRTAGRRGIGVRAVGAGHSFAPLAASTGLLIDTRALRGLAFSRREGSDGVEVSVGAGTSLGELAEGLHRKGLTVVGLATTTAPTVAGAVATGTHGGGRHASLSAQVTGVRVVTGSGDVVDVGDADPRLPALCLSLGVLGVLTRVTLRCVPGHLLTRHERDVGWDQLVEDPVGWAGAAEHVSTFWFPWQDRLLLRTLDRPGHPEAANPASRIPREPVRTALRSLLCRAPLTGAAARYAASATRPGPTPPHVAAAHRNVVFPQRLRFAALEYAVALPRLPQALIVLRGALRDTGFVSPLPLEIRPGPAEPTWLSPAHDRGTAWINLAAPRAAGRERWLRAAEQVLAGMGGRPHWAKQHGLDASVLRDLYPRWDDFHRVREALDPDGLFLSPYTRRLLIGPSAPHRPADR
ncbi:D-arabinono-1,4-lactone oxidase [Streptomyces fractus]|uniref:D-arabinono-1,4-lactone oxidase n=1 Tax=Streptomyces fractus TaxID=641806 RepID=UPI003CEC6220